VTEVVYSFVQRTTDNGLWVTSLMQRLASKSDVVDDTNTAFSLADLWFALKYDWGMDKKGAYNLR